MVTGFLLLMLQIPEGIEGLKQPRTSVASVRKLAEAPPEEAIPLLARALDADPGFAVGTNARQSAYQAASEMRTVLGAGTEQRKVIQIEAQIRLLEQGTRESSSGIRQCCVQSVGAWTLAWQELALEVLARTLLDVDPVVRLESCRSVSPQGTAAESLMPTLELLLKGVGRDGKPLSWHRADGLYPQMDHYEFSQRQEAALARMHVRSMDVDRGLFDGLDERGRDALCSAWARFGLGVILEHRRTSEESPEFLHLREHLDLLIKPLERPDLFGEEDQMSNESIVIALYHGNEIGLLSSRQRDHIRSLATTLLAREDLAQSQRERLRYLRDEFAK